MTATDTMIQTVDCTSSTHASLPDRQLIAPASPDSSESSEKSRRSPESDSGIQTKGCEVYVTRIPRHLKESDLLEIFEKIGKIADLRLMMGQSGQNKGYAYIRYTSVQEAKEAIKKMNNYEISQNRHLVVTKSVDNRRLWVNGIPKSKSIQEIRCEMERLTSGVIDIILYPSQTDKSRSRGYMFVEYDSHKSAAVARRKLSQGNVSICGQELGQVDWAEPEHEVDEETMSSVKILFIRNLMLTTTEDTIRNIFNIKGNNEVERVRKTKDFAFVHFSTRSAAENALALSKQLIIDGANVEVLWSKPVDKKLYNTRKTLTKAFTLGTEFIDEGNGTLKPISPVKRGAAGIQGLGAPGTAPSKHLVQKYVSMTRGGPGSLPGLAVSPQPGGQPTAVSNKLNIPHRNWYRSAPDLLHDISVVSQWGEPSYSYTVTEGPVKLYLCKVTLPFFPGQSNSFQGYQYRMSAEEARLDTVHQILAALRITPEYIGSLGTFNQMYQLTAGQLQGVPLTLPPQQGGGGSVQPPISTAGLRLYYPSEPYQQSNYAALVNSMCTMNICT